MSIGANKSKIFDKIKLYSSIVNSDIDNTSFSSIISSSNNPYDFLFDIVKTTVGENGLETLTQVVLSEVITQKYLNNLSDMVYDIIGNTIPDNLSSGTQTINVPVKTIDPTNSFRKNNTNQNSNSFNQQIKDNLLNAPNTDVNFGSLNMNYNENSNIIKTTIPDVGVNVLFNDLKTLIGSMFNANVVISEIINILFHDNFSKEDSQVLTMVRSYTNYETKDVFKMDLKKLLDLELDTSVNGYNIDVSCFRENITITKQQIDTLISAPTVENFKVLIPDLDTDITSNSKNDYYKNIIKTIVDAILSIILKQPVILFFISIINKVLDFTYDLKELDIPELFEKFKALFEKIFDEIYKEVFCVIFNWIKKQLLKLVVGVTIKLLKEQLEKRRDILESLSGSRFITKTKQFTI